MIFLAGLCLGSETDFLCKGEKRARRADRVIRATWRVRHRGVKRDDVAFRDSCNGQGAETGNNPVLEQPLVVGNRAGLQFRSDILFQPPLREGRDSGLASGDRGLSDGFLCAGISAVADILQDAVRLGPGRRKRFGRITPNVSLTRLLLFLARTIQRAVPLAVRRSPKPGPALSKTVRSAEDRTFRARGHNRRVLA